MLKKGIVLILTVLMVTTLLACQPTVPEESTTTVTISAAASLKDALAEIKDVYAKEAPKTELTLTFGPSGSLAEQIKQGAQVDVFLSASRKYMNDLNDAGEIDESSIRDLLANEVVLIAPKDSAISITEFSQLVDPAIAKIAIGEPKTVPVGQYASEVFAFYNLFDQISDKIIYGKDVKEVLTWVETGNVDIGLVYSTDAKVSDLVKVLATAPDESHQAIIYPTAVIKSSQNPQAAKAFIDFLATDAAMEIFANYGFKTV